MPRITKQQIEFIPEDRQIISEKSPTATVSTLTADLEAATTEGNVQDLFKLFVEISEKDPDVIQALNSRTSEIVSKEWTVEGPNGPAIEEALRNIPGDPTKGLLSVDGLINSMLGNTYMTGISMNEIVADSTSILGFNHIPAYFLTFYDTVWYPKLWTQEQPTGVAFNPDKMIYHVFAPGREYTRGYLGYAVALQYLFKKTTLEDRLQWQQKYGKGFLIVNIKGSEGAFDKDFETASDLIDNLYDTDGVVFSNATEAEMVAPTSLNGDFFFQANEDYKKNITKIILGQTSTSDSTDSNRSTAAVHMEVLDARILEDIQTIQDTLNKQLLPKIKQVLNISESDLSQFKFVLSDLEKEEEGEDHENEEEVHKKLLEGLEKIEESK